MQKDTCGFARNAKTARRLYHKYFIGRWSLCFSALSYYNATKLAVESLSEALYQEMESLGIKVMLVESSGFHTDWPRRKASKSKVTIADYAQTAGKARHMLRAISGNQNGNQILAVRTIMSHLILHNIFY